MTETQPHGGDPARPVNLLPYQELIRPVAVEDVFGWLAKGWRDFKAGGVVSLAYGAIFVVVGLLLTVGLFLAGYEYLIAPLLEAFLLVGPALTVGFYAISRDLELGKPPRFSAAISSWGRSRWTLLAFGLALVVFLIVWVRLAVMIFALSFPYTPLKLQPMINAVFFSGEGYVFLALGTAVGGVMATLVFMGSVVALPMILDRGVGLVQAVVVSFVAVLTNFRPLMTWAAIIVVVTGAGLAAGYVGLSVTLPLIGHASWHAYRGLVKVES
ncbi:MAG: DUF2189 domain-containing protein [Alphaproteobacteria bacterium]|nr:DUF2189 domain-containing protein [Alphaproteobacteria bacterium]